MEIKKNTTRENVSIIQSNLKTTIVIAGFLASDKF